MKAAMLANVSITSWSAKQYDRALSRQTATSDNAKEDAVKAEKILAPKSALAAIKKAEGAIRTFHLAQTLPWINRGPSLLPAKNFFRYRDGIAPLIAQYEATADDFCGGPYIALFEAAKDRMGDLFDAYDYPTPDLIRKRYSAAVDFQPLPDGGDFRLDLDAGTEQALKDDCNARVAKAEGMAMDALYDRAYEAVNHMATFLKGYDPKGGSRMWPSLVGNVKAIAELMPLMNVANDPKLDQFAKEIMADLAGYDTEDLKKDEALRGAVIIKAEHIASAIANR